MMAEKYKSVLESYNENKKPRRLPTAEEQAIQPVYPEEYLVGGPGKAVASGFLGSGKTAKAVKDASRYRIAQTRIGERAQDIDEVKEQIKGRAAFKNRPMYKEVFGDYETEQARQMALQKIKNTAKRSTNRSSTNFFGEAGNAIGNEVYRQNENAAGDTYKKGGKVNLSTNMDTINLELSRRSKKAK
jgi:hypothetical protein